MTMAQRIKKVPVIPMKRVSREDFIRYSVTTITAGYWVNI